VGTMSSQKGGPIVPGGPTPHYPPEFKPEAVKLYHSSGKSIPKMAEELGIASKSLRRWISQHEVDAGEREGLTTDERSELTQAREGVPEKSEGGRAHVFFAREAGPTSSLRGRKGLGELLQAHRGREDEISHPVHVPVARRFEEWLLRLERQDTLWEKP